MSDAVLSAEAVGKTYHDGTRELVVLKGVTLRIEPGEIVAILGRSGTGKSSLLNCLGLLDRPTTGRVVVEGTDASSLSDRARTRLRGRTLGFVFQRHHLLGEFNALENVLVAGGLAGRGDRARAEALLAAVGLNERLTHRPGQLSGGEQQRVAIARALLPHPQVLLCDEPTGNLDPHTGREVMDVLWKTVAEQSTAMIMVTHDEQVARRAARVLRLEDGTLKKA